MKDLELLGTEFQVKVWKEISKIPYPNAQIQSKTILKSHPELMA